MTRGRKNKTENYVTERMEILDKLNGILGIGNGINSFVGNDMDIDGIKGLIEDIKKVFSYSRWNYFMSFGKTDELSLIKSVYKEMGYVLDRKDIKENNVRKYVYTIRKAENPVGYLFVD